MQVKKAEFSTKDPLAHTQEWVERFVIGLNLCPFAGAVAAKGQIRYVLSEAKDIDILYQDLLKEPTNKGCQPGNDYYFVLRNGEGCKLPDSELPFGERQDCKLIKVYPVSDTKLWKYVGDVQ